MSLVSVFADDYRTIEVIITSNRLERRMGAPAEGLKNMIRIALIVGLMSASIGFGQAAHSLTAEAPTVKPMEFDVVSIRENVSAARSGPELVLGPTNDGYRMERLPIIVPIMTAYVPSVGGGTFSSDQISGLPEWGTRQMFDIDGRVAEEDLAQWRKPEAQRVMLQAMLRSVLEERCKIRVHREFKERPVLSLVTGKGGPKFKPTDLSQTHPGARLPYGGTMQQGSNGNTILYAASMDSLAALLSSMGQDGSRRLVVNRTGLTGEYDVELKMRELTNQNPGTQDTDSTTDFGAYIRSAIVESLGLKMEPSKSSVETLVIDHIEEPSEN